MSVFCNDDEDGNNGVGSCSDPTASPCVRKLLQWTEVCKDMHMLRDDLFRSMEDFFTGWDEVTTREVVNVWKVPTRDDGDTTFISNNSDGSSTLNRYDGDTTTYITDATSTIF